MIIYGITSCGLEPNIFSSDNICVNIFFAAWAPRPWSIRWEDGAPVLLRNPHRKTDAYVGPCRLVLSGHGKKALYLFYYTVRKAALLCWGLDSTLVFCNTRGKGLNASTVTAHLAALQLYCGVDEPLCSMDIRKAMASQLRGTKPGDNVAAGTVASALCHSVPTSDRYYVLGKGDRRRWTSTRWWWMAFWVTVCDRDGGGCHSGWLGVTCGSTQAAFTCLWQLTLKHVTL